MPRELLSQAAYARRRGISQAAVWKRTVTNGGPIPVHGPKKLIDVAEADALWEATMSPQGAATGRAGNYARFSAFQEQKGGPAGATTITAADCLRS
jgi:hypothetical protein